jgi:hypothetical protein
MIKSGKKEAYASTTWWGGGQFCFFAATRKLAALLVPLPTAMLKWPIGRDGGRGSIISKIERNMIT